MKYEITKMVTISTAHISDETIEMIEREVKYGLNNIPLSIYSKAEFGWFMYVPDDYEDGNIPEDLMHCLAFAKANVCNWLCLDCDGLVVDKLKKYV